MKNRDKYMKEIYKWIPTNHLVDCIGVDKKTGKPFECSVNKIGNCEKCLFEKEGGCDFELINKWLNKEEQNE